MFELIEDDVLTRPPLLKSEVSASELALSVNTNSSSSRKSFLLNQAVERGLWNRLCLFRLTNLCVVINTCVFRVPEHQCRVGHYRSVIDAQVVIDVRDFLFSVAFQECIARFVHQPNSVEPFLQPVCVYEG